MSQPKDEGWEVLKEILKRMFDLPQEERLKTISAAWMTVSQDDLADGFRNGEFKQVQATQIKLLDRMRDLVSRDHDLELALLCTEMEKAIEESDSAEVERLKKKFLSRME